MSGLIAEKAKAQPSDTGGVYRYHQLRAASERFQSDLAGLSAAQRSEVERHALRTLEIEDLVLASREACHLMIPAALVEGALAELQGRYPSTEAFLADLERNGLDQEALSAALHRELVFDAVMQQVAARQAQVDAIDERLFYELHRERFTRAERRTARHILITVNDAFEENRREVALARIEGLAGKMDGRPATAVQRFATLARKHSECPTALEGGRLGDLVRGQLFPELDALLFRLAEGQMGGPVESELGFHLVFCDRIQPSQTQPFATVRETIRGLLIERGRRTCQKAWLAELRRAARETRGLADAVEPK